MPGSAKIVPRAKILNVKEIQWILYESYQHIMEIIRLNSSRKNTIISLNRRTQEVLRSDAGEFGGGKVVYVCGRLTTWHGREKREMDRTSNIPVYPSLWNLLRSRDNRWKGGRGRGEIFKKCGNSEDQPGAEVPEDGATEVFAIIRGERSGKQKEEIWKERKGMEIGKDGNQEEWRWEENFILFNSMTIWT